MSDWLFRLGMVFLLCASSAWAENSTRTGGYTIHHNALTTDNLPENVASAYGIQRSKHRGMLNVSVIQDKPGTTGTPVHAEVRVVARSLFGQARNIAVREIQEGDAVYYIGDFPVAHREMLLFDLEVMPANGRYPLRAHLRQEFYTD